MSETNCDYFPQFTGTSTSIIYALNSLHIESGLYNRGKIAEANGIKNYTGKVIQDRELMMLLKEGKLIKP